MGTFNDLEIMYIINSILFFCMIIFSLLADLHYKIYRLYIGSGLLAGFTVPFIILGFMFPTDPGVLPVVFFMVPFLLLLSWWQAIRTKIRETGE